MQSVRQFARHFVATSTVLAALCVEVGPRQGGGLSVSAAPSAHALEIAGCTLWVIPDRFWNDTRPCLDRKFKEALDQGVELTPGCRLTFKDIGASAACFAKWAGEEADRAVKTVTGVGIKDILDAAAAIAGCGGQAIGDIVAMFRALVDNPGGFVAQTFGDVFGLVRDAVRPIFSNAGSILADLMAAVAGDSISDDSLNKLFDWLWAQVQAVGAKVKSGQCFINVAKPFVLGLKNKAFGLVRTLVKSAHDLFASVVTPALAKLFKLGLDKVLGALMGTAAMKRIKQIAARALDPTAHAARVTTKVRELTAALSAGEAGAISARWKEVRALIDEGNAGLGAKKLGEIATSFLRWATDKLIDKVGQRVVQWVAKIPSSGVNLVNRLIDGVCGLIPEAGAAICTVAFSGILRLAWDILGNTTVQKVAIGALKALADAVVSKLGRVITDRLAGKLGTAAEGNDDSAQIANAMGSVINFLAKGIEEAVQPERKKQAELYDAVLKLGTRAVDFLTAPESR